MRFQHACIRVAEHLAGQNLVDGDAVLDEARKVVFDMHFENCPVAEIADAMAASDLARAICVEIQHLSFDDAARVLGRVRLVLWRVNYQNPGRRGVGGIEGDAADAMKRESTWH